MIWVLIIGVLIEALWDADKISYGLNTKTNEWIRVLTGIGMFVYWYFLYESDMPVYEQIIAVASLGFFGYWFLFDGVLNLMRGLNWFYIGTTKEWDRFWRSHTGLVALSHFLKWAGVLSSLIYLYNPYYG